MSNYQQALVLFLDHLIVFTRLTFSFRIMTSMHSLFYLFKIKKSYISMISYLILDMRKNELYIKTGNIIVK